MEFYETSLIIDNLWTNWVVSVQIKGICLAYLSDNLHSYIISHFLVNMIDEVYMYIEIASYFCTTLCREYRLQDLRYLNLKSFHLYIYICSQAIS